MHTTTCTSLTTYSATSPDQRSSTELRSSSVPHRPPTRRHRCHRGSGLAQPRLGHARFGPRGGQIRPSPLLPPPSAASATASCPKMHGSRQIWTYMARFGCPPCSLCHRSGMGACQHWVGRRAKPPVASHLKKRRKGKKREKEEGREGKGGRGGGAGHHRRRRRCWWPRGWRPCTGEVGEAGFTSRVAERGDTGVRCGRVEEIQNGRNLIQYCSFVTFSFYNFG